MEATLKTNIHDIYKPARWLGEITCDLSDLQRMLAHDDTNLSPSYQRGSVWTREQRELFMGHLISGGEILPIIVQRVPDCGNAELLDGKQRIESMLGWLAGEFPARLEDGRTFFVNDVTGPISRVTFRVKYINLPFNERKLFYVRFNSAGTPHTREELDAALAACESR